MAADAFRETGPLWDYLRDVAGDGLAARRNRTFWDNFILTPRAFGTRNPDQTAEIFGFRFMSPFGIAPVAFPEIFVDGGAAVLASASHAAGTVYVHPFLSSTPLAAVSKAGAGDGLWLQVYPLKDRKLLTDILVEAQEAGFRALVVTVDLSTMGNRSHPSPAAPSPFWLASAGLPAYEYSSLFADATWDDFERIRACTDLPIAVKGVLDPADARIAQGLGAAGAIVSNHGGRQFDAAPSSGRALLNIASVQLEDFELMVDGGLRNGLDVLRAVAAGAKLAFFGRQAMGHLYSDGMPGLTSFLSRTRDDLTREMSILGWSSLLAQAAGR